ncbi:uncharacterized protein LOC132195014 isoform X2 [Neocloeon triangulifer]|uniref:uncharacterized protein LOC132195014 isoform X2 n=1 Tax=Neocloeon triangulifer TaxID=2078957 RepID=UPI00286F7D9B|nr:uncharacterized protein LOC132195014 isoform X2 [Neocloeon triangulifer]
MNFLMVFSVVIALGSADCDPTNWVDPSDLHSYDHTLKKNVGSPREGQFFSDPSDLHGFGELKSSKASEVTEKVQRGATALTSEKDKQNFCAFEIFEKTESELRECKKMCTTSKEKLTMSLLQRQTSMILAAANLMTEPSDGGSYSYHERYMIIFLEDDALKKLQEFAKTGEIDLLALDSIWSNMLVKAESPNVLRWYHLSYWKPEFSRENFYLFVGIGTILTVVLMMIIGVSMLKIFCLLLLLSFVFSVSMRAFKVHQANSARMMHLSNPLSIKDMPSACRPHSRNWLETLKHFGESDEFNARLCAQYYEDGYTDPMTHIDPLEIIVLQYGQNLVSIASATGRASRLLFDNFFDTFGGIPFISPIIGVILKLLLCIVCVISFILIIWLVAPTMVKEMLRSRTGSRYEPQSVCGTSSANPHPIIVNVNLPSGAIISNEITPPRRFSEPTMIAIEDNSNKNAKLLKKLQSEPIFKNCEPLPKIDGSSSSSVEEILEQCEQVQVEETESCARESPIFTLDDSNASQESKSREEDPESPQSTNQVVEVHSPLLVELERIANDLDVEADDIEE